MKVKLEVNRRVVLSEEREKIKVERKERKINRFWTGPDRRSVTSDCWRSLTSLLKQIAEDNYW